MKILISVLILIISMSLDALSCEGEKNAFVKQLNFAKQDFYSQEDYRIEIITNGAKNGDSESQYILGIAYFYGKSVGVDLNESKKWFRLSADNGYAKAQYIVANNLYHGIFGFKKSKSLAKEYLEKAVAQGNNDAVDLLRKIEILESEGEIE